LILNIYNIINKNANKDPICQQEENETHLVLNAEPMLAIMHRHDTEMKNGSSPGTFGGECGSPCGH
jgi:hypothetical protein